MVPGEDSMAGAAAAGNVDTEYAVPWNGRRNESERSSERVREASNLLIFWKYPKYPKYPLSSVGF